MKLVNSRATQAVLDVSNHEPAPISVLVVGGSLTTPIDTPGAPDPPVVLRNLTASKYSVQIPAGESETLTYAFATEMHPQVWQEQGQGHSDWRHLWLILVNLTGLAIEHCRGIAEQRGRGLHEVGIQRDC